MDLITKMAYLGLLTSNPMPITRFGPKFLGGILGATPNFQALFKNELGRPVSITVTASFAVPGNQVRLSFEPNGTDAYQVGILSSGGPVISGTIVLPTQKTLYIANADPTFPLTDSDEFRVLIFDPMKILETNFG